jgi:hypothetical protein
MKQKGLLPVWPFFFPQLRRLAERLSLINPVRRMLVKPPPRITDDPINDAILLLRDRVACFL